MENEATSATTRQYAPQQAANPYDAPYQSQLAQARSAPDNRANNQTPDTSRLYQDPMAPNYPNYPATSTGVAKKSSAMKWVLITLACILLVSGGISVMVISAIRSKQQAARQAAEDIRKKIDEELARARRESEGAPEVPGAPAPPPPPPISGAGLEQYKYPNAKVKNSVRFFGSESVTMTTDDSVRDVKDYYQKRLGAPMIEDEDDAVIFKVAGPPTILITIDKDKSDSDKTEITVLRSKFLPKMN